jgi:hypothetical protein
MSKPATFLDPVKEAQAVAALIESLNALGEGADETLLLDTIEGETNLLEAVDRLLERMAQTRAQVAGLEIVINDLGVRKKRFEDRINADRALIEQALMIAELEKVERPTATLFLSRRAPKVEIAEEGDIPAEFWKPGEPKLDKKAVLEALKEGRPVPGACLSNAAPSLTVRTA